MLIITSCEMCHWMMDEFPATRRLFVIDTVVRFGATTNMYNKQKHTSLSFLRFSLACVKYTPSMSWNTPSPLILWLSFYLTCDNHNNFVNKWMFLLTDLLEIWTIIGIIAKKNWAIYVSNIGPILPNVGG